MAGRTVIVGAGIAGLSCAVNLASRGNPVQVYESAGHAGGRCRSFFDPHLDRRIDNGNHLLLSGNRAAFAYLSLIGAAETLAGPPRAEFDFFDLESGARWRVAPNPGRLPWWIFARGRRVPGTRAVDYLRGARLARARPDQTVADVLDDGSVLYHTFWHPLAVAVMNADPEEAAAAPLWPVVRETFGRGESAVRPRVARNGLSESFVDPALAFLESRGAEVHLNRRVRRLDFSGDRIAAIDLVDSTVDIGPADVVVLAVPASPCAALVPDLDGPTGHRAIVNAHFRIPEAVSEPTMIGLIGGAAQWLFRRGDIASVTISAADDLALHSNEEIAKWVWAEVSRALGFGQSEVPPYRIVKERRATFAQTPSQVSRRPATRSRWCNLMLAGDWTDTGLPATIEGAIRSGEKAAKAVLSLSEGS